MIRLERRERIVTLFVFIILAGTIFVLSNASAYASTSDLNQFTVSYGGQTYVVEYNIENATLDNIEVDLEKQALRIQIGNTTTSDGRLTITFPRSLIDSVCGKDELPFLVTINDIVRITERDPGTNEIATNADNRTIEVTFPSRTNTIFIGTFSSEPLSACSSLSLMPNKEANGIEYSAQAPLDIGNIVIDKEQSKVIIPINNPPIRDGFMRLELSRDVIDSRNANGNDTDFVISYSKGEESESATYYEISTNNTTRILVAELPAGFKEITISGTHVIPEFGFMAMLVLSIALLGIITLAARFHRFGHF